MLLSRHYIKEFLKLFGLIGAGLSLALSLFDLIDRLDGFMPHDPAMTDLIRFALLNLPKNFLYLMPVGALLSSLYTMGQASRAKETTAVMAAGGRLKRLLLPFIAAGAAMSLAGFVISEFVSPRCLKEATELKRSIMGQGATPSLFKQGAMWLRAKDGSIVNIKLYVEDRDSFQGMSVFRIDGGGLKEIIKAEEASYIKATDTWVLKGVRKYDTQSAGIEEVAEMSYPDLGSPEVFREEARKPAEMGITELAGYIKRLREAGFRNARLEVEMNSKVSFPMVNLFMTALGVSLAARRGMKGLAAAAVGLLISLFYYFGYTMMLSLGYSGILPPVAAVWAVPSAFGAVAAYLFAGIPE